MQMGGATVETWTPERNLWDLNFLTSSGVKLALLPDRIDPDTGVAYYREEVAGTLKLVRKHFADTDFSIPSSQRKYLSEYAIGDVTTWVGLAILSPLIYDVVKATTVAVKVRVRARLGLAPTDDVSQDPVTVKVALLRAGSFEARGIEITGTVEDVERTLLDMVQEIHPVEPGGVPEVE